ncbi:hypothetical protein LINPERHAP1_LOCUS4112 [Linum perenne]
MITQWRRNFLQSNPHWYLNRFDHYWLQVLLPPFQKKRLIMHMPQPGEDPIAQGLCREFYQIQPRRKQRNSNKTVVPPQSIRQGLNHSQRRLVADYLTYQGFLKLLISQFQHTLRDLQDPVNHNRRKVL